MSSTNDTGEGPSGQKKSITSSDWTYEVHFFDYSDPSRQLQEYGNLKLYQLAERIAQLDCGTCDTVSRRLVETGAVEPNESESGKPDQSPEQAQAPVDKIICLEYYKAKLSSEQKTKANAFHAFVIVGTTNVEYQNQLIDDHPTSSISVNAVDEAELDQMTSGLTAQPKNPTRYYSIEKNPKCIIIQRSLFKDDVVNYIVQANADSTYGFSIQERINPDRKHDIISLIDANATKRYHGATGRAIVGWICANIELHNLYDDQLSNCHHFSERLLRMLTGRKFDIAKQSKLSDESTPTKSVVDTAIDKVKSIYKSVIRFDYEFLYSSQELESLKLEQLQKAKVSFLEDFSALRTDVRAIQMYISANGDNIATASIKQIECDLQMTHKLIRNSIGYLSCSTELFQNYINECNAFLDEIAIWKDSVEETIESSNLENPSDPSEFV